MTLFRAAIRRLSDGLYVNSEWAGTDDLQEAMVVTTDGNRPNSDVYGTFFGKFEYVPIVIVPVEQAT